MQFGEKRSRNRDWRRIWDKERDGTYLSLYPDQML